MHFQGQQWSLGLLKINSNFAARNPAKNRGNPRFFYKIVGWTQTSDSMDKGQKGKKKKKKRFVTSFLMIPNCSVGRFSMIAVTD